MTETLVGVNPSSSKDPADPPPAEELAAAKELVRQAGAQRGCVDLSGWVVESADQEHPATAAGATGGSLGSGCVGAAATAVDAQTNRAVASVRIEASLADYGSC